MGTVLIKSQLSHQLETTPLLMHVRSIELDIIDKLIYQIEYQLGTSISNKKYIYIYIDRSAEQYDYLNSI